MSTLGRGLAALLVHVHQVGNTGRGIGDKEGSAVCAGGGNVITEYDVDSTVVQGECVVGRVVGCLPSGSSAVLQVDISTGNAALQRAVGIAQSEAVGIALQGEDIAALAGGLQGQAAGQGAEVETCGLDSIILGILSGGHDVVAVGSAVGAGGSDQDQVLAGGQVSCGLNQSVGLGVSSGTGTGAGAAVVVAAVTADSAGVGTLSSAGAAAVGAVHIVSAVVVAGVGDVVAGGGDLSGAENCRAIVTGYNSGAGGSAGCGSSGGRGIAVRAGCGAATLIQVHESGAGRGSRRNCEDGVAVVTVNTGIIAEGHVQAAALQGEALGGRVVAAGPGGSGAIVQTDTVIAGVGVQGTVVVAQSKAICIALEGETKGSGSGGVAGNSGSNGGQVDSLTLHAGIGAVFRSGQSVIGAVSADSDDDVLTCSQVACRGDQIIGQGIHCATVIGCGSGVGGGGRTGTGVDELVGRVNSLHCINLALAGIGILVGNNDGECSVLCLSLRLRIACISGVPVTAGCGLHVRDSSSHIGACLHLVPEVGLVLVVAGEGNGLRIAVNNFTACCTHGGLDTCGSHAQADSHPQDGAGSSLAHVVLDSGAVYAVSGAAVKCMVIGAVGTGNSSHIGAGDAGGGLQAQVGGICTSGVVAVAVVVVSGAVGVEDHDAAVLEGVSNVGDGCVGAFVQGVLAAGSAGDGGSFVLVLVGEAGVIAIVGGDQEYILVRGGCLGTEVLDSGVVVAGSGQVTGLEAELGGVAANDTLGGFPSKERTVTNDSALYIGLGLLDQCLDLVGQLCIVSGVNGVVTGLDDVLILESVDLVPDVSFDDGFCLLGDLLTLGLLHHIRCGSESGKHAAKHSHGQNDSKKLHADFLHRFYISFQISPTSERKLQRRLSIILSL